MSEEVDIRPDVHFLQSIRADRGAWWVLAAEAIDNGFDFAATQLVLLLSRTEVVIEDNGAGITRDRALSMVRLGEHRAGLTTALGRFGIGITYNAISAADYLEVRSISQDGRLDLIADWEAMLRRGEWKIPVPRWSSSRHPETGTRVTLRAIRWPGPTSADIQRVRDQLAPIFRPALGAGRIIMVNGIRIPFLREPELRDVIDTTIQLPSGKGARVRAGMLVEPESSPLYMVNLTYRHRVIDAKSAFGTGGFSGLRRMFAEVTLSGNWGLRRFKDGLADTEADALDERVTEVLRPILEQCHSAQFSTTIEEMAARLNEMLPTNLVPARPPHKKGSDEPTSPQRKRKPHGRSDGPGHPTGPARTRSPRSTLVIDFDGPLAAECGYGEFKKGTPSKIILAKDNPDIAEWLAHRDRTMAARAIYAVAMMIYEHAREHGQVAEQLPITSHEPFGLRVWQLAQRQKITQTGE